MVNASGCVSPGLSPGAEQPGGYVQVERQLLYFQRSSVFQMPPWTSAMSYLPVSFNSPLNLIPDGREGKGHSKKGVREGDYSHERFQVNRFEIGKNEAC